MSGRALEDAAQVRTFLEEELHGVEGRDGHQSLDHRLEVEVGEKAEHGDLLVSPSRTRLLSCALRAGRDDPREVDHLALRCRVFLGEVAFSKLTLSLYPDGRRGGL